MELNNTISTPLYKQLENILKDKIENGDLTPGSRIPTESELSEQYNISRVTVRKALSSLSQRGLITRKSAKGTFVSEKKMQREVNGLYSFSEMCKLQNVIPGAKTIKIEISDPTSEEAEQLRIEPSDKILVIERIRYASGAPVVLEITKFPESFFFLFDEDLNNISLYTLLEKKYNILFTCSSKTIELTFANYKEARYLGITKGAPLLCIDSLVHDETDTYRHISHQLCIGDKFKLKL